MLRRLSILLMLVTIVSGCAPSAKEKYDAAVQQLDKAQEQLDKLRPAYDVATQTATNAVCRELAGMSKEESDSSALQGLGNVLNQTPTAQIDPAKVDPAKAGEQPKKVPAGRKGDDLDKLIDNLGAAQKDMAEKQAALTAPLLKVQEVMKQIKTPGTPEAKKYEEKLAAMPEAKAYERQQKRVERAQKDVEELEKELPGGGDKSDDKK